MSGRDPIGNGGVSYLSLRPYEALRHGRFWDQERSCDFEGGKSCQGPKRKSHLRVRLERGMAAGEHQAEPVVVDAAVVPARSVSSRRVLRPRRRIEHRYLLELRQTRRLATDTVHRAIPRGCHEPCAGDARDAVALPTFGGRREGVL